MKVGSGKRRRGGRWKEEEKEGAYEGGAVVEGREILTIGRGIGKEGNR